MANVAGRGLRSAKKGERPGGRPPGSQNRFTRELKEELLGAADDVGEIEETPILDKDGKPTDYTIKRATGKDGLRGYLRWAAVHQPTAFLAQLGRVLPLQVNVKSEAPKRVVYPSLEDTRAALRANGIDPDVIERAMMPKFLTDQRADDIVDVVVDDDAKPN